MGRKLSREEVISKFRNVHGDRYDYSKVVYVDMNSKVTIICPEHGEFYVTPDNHLRGRGCPRCKQSHGEDIIEAWLRRSNIRYKRQFVLINQEIGRPSHRLVIDFFVKHKGRQYFIEYDGEQHFSPTYKFYDSMDDFYKQQRRDQLLNDFCDNHKDAVTLIRVNCRQCEAEITHILSNTIA